MLFFFFFSFAGRVVGQKIKASKLTSTQCKPKARTKKKKKRNQKKKKRRLAANRRSINVISPLLGIPNQSKQNYSSPPSPASSLLITKFHFPPPRSPTATKKKNQQIAQTHPPIESRAFFFFSFRVSFAFVAESPPNIKKQWYAANQTEHDSKTLNLSYDSTPPFVSISRIEFQKINK